MAGATGNALEWALALLRAPGERHALRHKPLPAGMERLLGIAAGAAPDDLAEVALAFGESQARVREAAQFYAREVLFFPQADAYRVLGVNADAGDERIKAHHRLLQHWLHPDRLQSEDDAIFAARVNSAWNQLRNPQRRQAYDEALRRDPVPEAFDGSGAQLAVHAWLPHPEAPRERWRRRLPMLALSAACLLLVLLVLHDMERRPQAPDWFGERDSAAVDTDAAMRIDFPQHALAQPRDAKASDAARPGRSPVAMTAPVPQHVAGTQVSRDGAPMSRRMQQTLAAASPAPARASESGIAAALPPATKAPLPVLAAAPVQAQVQAMAKPASAQQYPQADMQQHDPQRPPPSFARIQSARQAGEQLLRYMGAPDRPPPPIWNSPAIQSSADRMRQDLHAAAGIRLSTPQWRIGNEAAVLTSGYAGQADGADNGRLVADLIWREGHWLVTGLSMEQAR